MLNVSITGKNRYRSNRRNLFNSVSSLFDFFILFFIGKTIFAVWIAAAQALWFQSHDQSNPKEYVFDFDYIVNNKFKSFK